MKKYIEPQLEIVNAFPENFCAVVDVISENEVNDRHLFVIEDELD